MPEPPMIPEEAVQAAAEALQRREFTDKTFTGYARTVLEAAAPFLAEQERRKVAERITAYEDLLGSIWLYIGWRYVTEQLTTEQKEMFAAAVESSSRRLNDDDPAEPLDVDRWWRDDAPIRQTGDAHEPR